MNQHENNRENQIIQDFIRLVDYGTYYLNIRYSYEYDTENIENTNTINPKNIRDSILLTKISENDKIKDMTNAMKVIQEKSPCPVANNYGENENSYWGGGKRSTRKLSMKKRRKSLRYRRF